MNIDMDNNALDIDLARSVGEYFMLSNEQTKKIIREVTFVVRIWKNYAIEMGIKKSEQEIMESAFNV